MGSEWTTGPWGRSQRQVQPCRQKGNSKAFHPKDIATIIIHVGRQNYTYPLSGSTLTDQPSLVQGGRLSRAKPTTTPSQMVADNTDPAVPLPGRLLPSADCFPWQIASCHPNPGGSDGQPEPPGPGQARATTQVWQAFGCRGSGRSQGRITPSPHAEPNGFIANGRTLLGWPTFSRRQDCGDLA